MKAIRELHDSQPASQPLLFIQLGAPPFSSFQYGVEKSAHPWPLHSR